jgi:hypothetical protein
MSENTPSPVIDDYPVAIAVTHRPAAVHTALDDAAEPARGFRHAIRSMLADSAQYLVGLALLSLASVALVPLYTRQLTPAEFGVYALVDVSVLGLLTIASLGLNVAYLKWFAVAKPSEVPALFSEMLLAGGGAAAILGAAFSFLLHIPLGAHWFGFAREVLPGSCFRSWLWKPWKRFSWPTFERCAGPLRFAPRARCVCSRSSEPASGTCSSNIAA